MGWVWLNSTVAKILQGEGWMLVPLVQLWMRLINKRVNKAAPWVMLPPRAPSRVWTQLFYSLFLNNVHVALVFCCSCFGFLAPVLLFSCQSTFTLAAFSGGRSSFFFYTCVLLRSARVRHGGNHNGLPNLSGVMSWESLNGGLTLLCHFSASSQARFFSCHTLKSN